MAYQHRQHHHNGTIIPGKTPLGSAKGLLFYALLPLLLTILFVIFFLASGKIHI